ncbi:MAG: hypothetical protein N3A58_03855 [Spirochaetes bacterium]|nr:hypothetical protein [Spirochaetota bacterium]
MKKLFNLKLNHFHYLLTLSIFLIALIIFNFSHIILGQSDTADASIILHQNTLNKFLSSIGTLRKTNTYNIMGLKGEYTWEIINPKIVLTKDKASFIGDVNIILTSINSSYKTPVNGTVSIKYNKETNKISVKVEKASFDINIKVLGKDTKIGEVDLAKYYQIKFEFPGPKPYEAQVDVEMPDGKIKKIKIDTNPILKIEDEKIVVGAELIYTPLN